MGDIVENRDSIYVNCGAFRPKWMRKRQRGVRLHFCFSLEVPASEHSLASTELHELVHELVSRWSSSCYVRLKRQESERKRGKKWQE